MVGAENTWFRYMVRCRDGSLYSGIAKDVEERVRRHNWGVGPAFTSKRRPVVLVWCEGHEDSQAARRREREIKGWSRQKKSRLIEATKGKPFGRLQRPQGKGE